MLKVKLPNLLDALNEVKTPKMATSKDKTDLGSKPDHEKVKIEKKAKTPQVLLALVIEANKW